MERSFKKEVDALRLGAGETFRGEGILAVTKALLQSGVSYVVGYQGGAGFSSARRHGRREDLLADLGVHLETCTNEAAAAAMLGASAWLASESSNPFSTICTKCLAGCLAGLSRTPVRAIAAE